MDVRGPGGVECVTFHRYKVYKIQHFRKCICILGIFLCSSGPGLAPSELLYFYTQHSISTLLRKHCFCGCFVMFPTVGKLGNIC